jgi:hypothetical protein
MQRNTRINHLVVLSALSVILTTPGAAQDWNAVDAAMGRASVAQPGDVHRYNFPRSDLRVTAAGVRLAPAFALGGWIAMKTVPGGIHGDAVMVVGDLVLLENELTTVIARLQDGGVDVTAIHHHLIRESPRILYVHVHVMGDALRIAETIHAAVALTRTPPPAPVAQTMTIAIDTAGIARELGVSGKVNGGVYQVSVPRAESIREGEFEIPPSMGVATAINFQPTGRGRAAIVGDVVMRANEVNEVIRALRANGIEATSFHSHMLNEEPRLFFLHFWANDDAVKLARGLRAALDRTNSKR